MTSLHKVLKSREDVSARASIFEQYQEFTLNPQPEVPDETAEKEEPKQKSVLDEAGLQAEKILREARKKAKKIEEEAFQKGYKQGEEAGYKAGALQAMEEDRERFEEEMEVLQGKIAQYIDDVTTEKEKLLEKYIDDLKNISISIGEKIVQTSLKSSEKVIERMILAATEKLKKAAWAKIYIGRGKAPMDVQGDPEFLRSISKLADNVKVIMMDQEEPGTCIVELPDEIIDISVGTQLENIREILNNARL